MQDRLLSSLLAVSSICLMFVFPLGAFAQPATVKDPTFLRGMATEFRSAKYLDDNDRLLFAQLAPGTTTTRQQAVSPIGGPTVTGSTPNLRIVTKGAGYASITFTGSNFNKVRGVSVINAGGRVEQGFTTIVNPRGRTDSRLNIGVLSGPSVTEGSFDLRLYYERPQTTPNATKDTPFYMPVPPIYGRFSVRSMKTSVTLSPNPNVKGQVTFEVIDVNGVPGNRVTDITRFGANLPSSHNDSYCWYNVFMSIRKIVTCDSPNAGQRKTSSLDNPFGDTGKIVPVVASTYDFKREANACYEMAKESYSSKWLAPNRLQIRMPNGKFEHPRLGYTQGSACYMRFSIKTKDAAGNDWRIYTDNAALQLK